MSHTPTTAGAPPRRVVTVHCIDGLEFVAHDLDGYWLLSWAWRGRLVFGFEPYVSGSDAEN